MTDETSNTGQDEIQADAKADRWAIVIMFTAAVLMAVHFISGFTFDF